MSTCCPGLPNRGRVRQLLGEALRAATTGNVPCAIMFLDLDGFKPVNDTFGHPKGDAVLRAVAKRLVDEVGADGHVGRMGGDEFAIVVPDAQSRKQGREARRPDHRRDQGALSRSTRPKSASAFRSAAPSGRSTARRSTI